MKTLCIIPARGGSKRIPKKNIKKFVGKPIISYPIQAAIASKCFDEVMVSTDDQKIANVAKKYGATIPFMRDLENSQDKSILIDVILEVLLKYKKLGKFFDYVCCLLPTAPFVSGRQLNLSLKLLKDSGATALIPVLRFSHPIQRAFRIKNHRLEMIWPVNMKKNSQDLEPTYHDAGQFYWLKVNQFLKEKKIFSSYSIPLEIPEYNAQDIDTFDDWKIAELKFKYINHNQRRSK